MDNNSNPVERTVEQLPAPQSYEAEPAGIPRKYIVMGVIAVLVILVLIGLAIWGLLQSAETTAVIRDIFIIFMAFETLLLGLVLILLLLQLARLTNLLQNEIKPILDSTNETINTLRGTTAFLSDNLVEPVMKLGEYTAALQQFMALLGLGRKRKRTK